MAEAHVYLAPGANVEATDTFASWVETTNMLVSDMGTKVLTTTPYTQPNTTVGGYVTGNSHIEGIFSGTTMVASGELRGGTVSTTDNLVITSNTVFDKSELVRVSANTNNFTVNANNTLFTGNVAIQSSKTVLIQAANTTINSGYFFVRTNTELTGTRLDVDGTTADFTSNTIFTSATMNANVDVITLGFNGTDQLNVNSRSDFNANVNVDGIFTSTANTLFTGAQSQFDNNVIIGSTTGDSLSVNAYLVTDLLPSATTVDLGSDSKPYGNVHTTKVWADSDIEALGEFRLKGSSTKTLRVSDTAYQNLNVVFDNGVTANTALVANTTGIYGGIHQLYSLGSASVNWKNLYVQSSFVTGNEQITGDLAVNGGDLTTSSTTFNLLETNATTVNAFGTATAIDIGSTSGTTTLNNPTVRGSQATVNLWDTTSTTVNAFGASTALRIGSTSGTFTLRNPTVVGTQTTVNLWDTTSTTVNAFGAATALRLGSTSGTFTLRNPVVVGTQATVDLWNTTSTTVNAFGAATAINVGATTGTFTLRNPVVVGTQTSVNLWDTTSTTVNAFGAATALRLGSTSGTLTLRNPTVVGASATVNLWDTVSTTVNAFGAASVIQIGAGSGTATIHNPTVVGSQTSVNLWDTVSTTVNAFGVASNMQLGAGSGTATIHNPTVVGSQTSVNLWDTVSTTVNAFGAGTTVNIANASGSQTVTLGGSSIGASVYNIGTGATASANTKTVNIATGGAAGSTTNVNIGSVVGGTTTLASGSIVGASTIVDLWDTVSTTVNAFGAATVLNLGAGSGTATINNSTLALNGGTVSTNKSTFTLLNTTATTVNAFGAATSLNLGASTGTTNIKNNVDINGDLNVDGGDLTTNGTSFRLINTNATTVNAFGAATTLTVGASTGTITINNSNIALNGSTVSTNKTTLALFDTTTTTVNAFGAATTLNLGAGSGNTYVNNDLTVVGDVSIQGQDLKSTTTTFNVVNDTATTINAFGAATAITMGGTSGTMTIRNSTLNAGNTNTNNLVASGHIQSGSYANVAGNLSVHGSSSVFDGSIQAASAAITGAVTVGTNLTVNGTATFNGNVDLQDNDKMLLGIGDDLQIYHDGLNSYIKDVGTGNLKIDSNNLVEILSSNNTATETMATFTRGGSVALYYSNSKIVETRNDGLTITGNMSASSANISGDFAATGTSSIGELIVSGIADISANTIVRGDFTVLGTTTLSSNSQLSLNVATMTTATVFSNLNSNGNTAIGSTTAQSLTINARVKSNIDPVSNILYDLGSSSLKWRTVYANNFVGNLDWAYVTNKPDPVVTLSGDIVGSATMTDMGSINISTTIQPNSIALGTDTVGNYISTITGTTNRVTVTGSGSEGSAVTLTLPQDIHTGANPTFNVLNATSYVNADQINAKSGVELILFAGESKDSSSHTGLTNEKIYVVAEGGLEVISSSNNWSGGWASANAPVVIGDSNGNSMFPGKVGIGSSATPSSELTVTGSAAISGNLVISGNLTINGTSTIVNSTSISIDDPILTLGGDTAPTSNDNKDRGIEFRYYDTAARLGFMGWDTSTNKFTLLKSATNTSEVFSGTKAELDAYVDWANLLSKPTYDNYVSWTIRDGDTTSYTVTSGDTLQIVGGTYITSNFTADDVLTISHDDTTRSDSTSSGSVGSGGNFTVVDGVTTNAQGHVTGINTKTVTIPASDNYVAWSLKDHDGTTYTVTSGDTVWIKDGSGIDVNFTADDELTITAVASGIAHNSLSGFVADEHIAHSGVTLTAGDGLSGGGTIAASRSFAVDSSVIRTTGNQTLGGIKTFSSTIVGSISGNAATATTANQVANTLTNGSYLTGSNYNGSAATTWAVDATSANTGSKVVARDSSGNFSAGTITASLSGNASTATTLQTTRTINGVNFNGSANINIGGLRHTNGSLIIDGTAQSVPVNYLQIQAANTAQDVLVTTAGTDTNIDLLIQTKGTGSITMDTGTGAGAIDLKPGASNVRIWDDTSTNYFQIATGTMTANRTLTMPNANVTLVSGTMVPTTGSGASGTWGISISGNAATASQVANTLTNGTYLTGSAYNGSGATTWAVDATSANTVSKVVARDASGNFSAGTITASLNGNASTATNATNASKVTGTLTNGTYLTGSNFNGSSSTTWAVDATSANTVSKIVARDASGNFSAGTVTASLNGNASTATKLATARTIALGGDLSGSVAFDGSANITITATVADDSHNHSNYITSNAADTVSANTEWQDGAQIQIGNGADTRLYHTGGNTYIDRYTGNLIVRDNITTRFTFERTTGNFTATGDINSTSDARVKENVVTIDSALDKVTNMRGVYFNKIGQVERKIGVIAQEVEAIIPEVVSEDSDGTKSVAYANIVGLLIEAIKELREEVKSLKGE